MNETLPPIPIDEERLWDLMCRADEMGLRLEMSQSGFTWEASPGWTHQELAWNTGLSLRRATEEVGGCECRAAQDLWIRFPNGVVRRPDIAIFCKAPADKEGFVHEAPEAVVEITNPGYDGKDLACHEIYLPQGVKDVLVLDRRTIEVHHWGPKGHTLSPSPTTFRLACGCSLVV